MTTIDDFLVYYHLLIPILLLFPLLFLLPPPAVPEPEPPGIHPITIKRVTPRRAAILLALCSLALTGVYDIVLLVVDVTTAAKRDEVWSSFGIASAVAYAVGGLVVWGLTAIVVEWRTKWGDRGIRHLGRLAIVLEVPNLVFMVIREIRALGPSKIFTILAIPPSAMRLLLLSILVGLSLAPRITYEPADEATRLLTENGGEGSRGREAYGTFDNEEQDGEADGNEDGTSKPQSSRTSSRPPTTAGGAATPKPQAPAPADAAQAKDGIKIPKKLGEVKKEDKPLTTREIALRLRKLAPHLWPSTSVKLQIYVLICMFTLILIRIGNPLLPLSLGRVVRSLTITSAGGDETPWVPFATYIALRYGLGGNGLLSFTQNVLWVGVAQYTDREMQMLCFHHLLNLSLAYHTKRNTGEVLKIIDRGSAINNLFQTMLFTAIPTVADMLIAFGVFFYLYGAMLAFIVLGIMLVYVVFSVTHTNYRMVLRRQMIDKDVKTRGIVSDVLTNWESVKYFTAEERESRRFKEAVLTYQETEAKVQIGFNLLSLVQFFLLTLGLTVGALIIAFRILHGQADAAEFVVFIQYYAQMQGPLDRFAWLYRILNQETTDAEKMFTLLSQATEVNDKPGAKDLVVTDGIIEFRDVRFSYDGKVPALKGVSFTIGKGQSMALVGESGSGKSTILRLLYRFYDITSGQILIDGQDISEVTQLSLRRAIGIVPQDSVLWNDTIGANISYGKEGAGDEEIISAAKAARLHERILSFAEGYSTIVGERGVRPAGGEKQRVSLARMFLKSPAILVLDEATSALDTETEREIQRALTDLAKNRSSLSIAHRLSTIINSDQIVVMKDGQVIENGGYKELLDLDGAFATMWKKQIFTEAEMVAQADGVAIEQVAKDLSQEQDPIDLKDIDGKNDESRRGDGGDSLGDGSHETASGEDDKGVQIASREAPQSAPHVDASSGQDEALAVSDETERTTEDPTGAAGFVVDDAEEAVAVLEAYVDAAKAHPVQLGAAFGAANPSETVADVVPRAAAEVDERAAKDAGTVGEPKQSKEEAQAEQTEQAVQPEMTTDSATVPTPASTGQASSDGRTTNEAAASAPAPEPVSEAASHSPNDADAELDEQTSATGSPAKSRSTSLAESPPTGETTPSSSKRGSIQFPADPAHAAQPSQAAQSVRPTLPTSGSQRSDMSELGASVPDLAGTDKETGVAAGGKDEKRRKRLSSIKGFVRRISDQGLVRSQSLGGKSPLASPAAEEEGAARMSLDAGVREGEADGKEARPRPQKRISLTRSRSDRKI